MELFFHLEGLARPHLDGSGLSSCLLHPQTHPPSPSAPSFETFGLCLTNGDGAAASTACRAGGQHRACQEIRGRAGGEELPFASCLPSDCVVHSAKYH